MGFWDWVAKKLPKDRDCGSSITSTSVDSNFMVYDKVQQFGARLDTLVEVAVREQRETHRLLRGIKTSLIKLAKEKDMAQKSNVKRSTKPILPGKVHTTGSDGLKNTLKGKTNTKASTNKAC